MKRLVLALAAVLAVSGPALAETWQPEDFARVMPLTLSAQGGLYELPLPAEVYAGARRRDLGDLAVFNGKGEIVPFTLVVPAPPKAASVGKALPIFPMRRAAGKAPGGIALQVRTDEHGATVSLNAAPAQGGGAPESVSGYIVDAGNPELPVTGFDLTLGSGVREYLGSLRVETSDDLQHWREHATGALATLSAGEHWLNRDRIEFLPVKARYFRLSLSPETGAPRVDALSARFESPLAGEHREKASYLLAPVKGKTGEYLVRITGLMPVDRLRLVFPEDNSLAGAIFYSRPDPQSAWVLRGCGTFYRLSRAAKTFESPPLELAPVTDREWLILVRRSAGGFQGALPQLEMGWQAHRLVFLARGEPPFRLAYGSARVGEAALRDDGVAAELQSWERQQIRPQPAQAGPSREAGGAQALRPRVAAATWRNLLLWGALLLGVFLLARMACQLVREMGLGGTKKN